MASSAIEVKAENLTSLRERKHTDRDVGSSSEDANEIVDDDTATIKDADENVLGRTPNGTVFKVPHTPDMLTSIFAINTKKTALDILTIVSLSLQILLFFYLSGNVRKIFFVFYFAFWRGAYNAGLGIILKAQSEKRWIVKLVKQKGWMDAKRCPKVHDWIRHHLKTKMDDDYDFEVGHFSHPHYDVLLKPCPLPTASAARVQRMAHVPIYRRCDTSERCERD